MCVRSFAPAAACAPCGAAGAPAAFADMLYERYEYAM